jgi:hypothetical protein
MASNVTVWNSRGATNIPGSPGPPIVRPQPPTYVQSQRDYRMNAIQNYVNSKVGHPIVPALDEEVNAMQTSINNALIQYWVCFPHIHMMVY